MLTTSTLQEAGVAHGFLTRQGGVSDGIYASLNCGNGSQDRPEHVAENRARALRRLGAGDAPLLTAHQIHSATAVVVDRPFVSGERPKADALVTRTPRLVLGVLTADCGPVLFAEPEAGVVAAAHAGWRGALEGILEATVETMESLGAKRGGILASIGPCIGARSYEVGPEFPEPFLERDAEASAFFSQPNSAGKRTFDLRGYIVWRLGRLEIGEVEALGNDTCAEEETFFSYRRARLRGEADYGRGLSAIYLS